MPQKPQDRAKDKRRLTRRLAKWKAKREQSQATSPDAAGSSQAAPKGAAQSS
jgi:hypothetical protein